jgi:hypothetical protein
VLEDVPIQRLEAQRTLAAEGEGAGSEKAAQSRDENVELRAQAEPRLSSEL